MALQRIIPSVPARDVKVATVSIATVARSIRLRFSVPQLDVGAFSTEQDGPQYAAGIIQAILTLNTMMSKGTTESVPLIPPPQQVATEVVYSTAMGTPDCDVQFASMNFEESNLDYDYGIPGTTPYTARSSSSFTIEWAAA